MGDLGDYVAEMIRRGYSVETIKKKLIESGYDKKTIDNVINQFKDDKYTIINKKIIIIFSIFLLIALFIFFFNNIKKEPSNINVDISENLSRELNISKSYFNDQMYFSNISFSLVWDSGCNIDFKSALVNYAHIIKKENSTDIQCKYEFIHNELLNSINFNDNDLAYKGIIIKCNENTAKLIDDTLTQRIDSCAVRGMENKIPELKEYYFMLYACKKSKINFKYSEALKSSNCFRGYIESTKVKNGYSFLPIVFDPATQITYT